MAVKQKKAPTYNKFQLECLNYDKQVRAGRVDFITNIWIKAFLTINGIKVGYRVDFGGSSTEFDVDLDLFAMVCYDFRLDVKGSDAPEVSMVKKSGLWIAEGIPDAPTLTYRAAALIVGYSYMSDCDVELKKKYNEYNEKVFGGQLTRTLPLFWSGSMVKAGGAYRYFRRDGAYIYGHIQLSKQYVNKYPGELDSILLHEMIHVEIPEALHGPDFLNRAKEVSSLTGVTVNVFCEGQLERKYKFKCSKCTNKWSLRSKKPMQGKRCVCGGDIIFVEFVKS